LAAFAQHRVSGRPALRFESRQQQAHPAIKDNREEESPTMDCRNPPQAPPTRNHPRPATFRFPRSTTPRVEPLSRRTLRLQRFQALLGSHGGVVKLPAIDASRSPAPTPNTDAPTDLISIQSVAVDVLARPVPGTDCARHPLERSAGQLRRVHLCYTVAQPVSARTGTTYGGGNR
jgi:hypothetical protein